MSARPSLTPGTDAGAEALAVCDRCLALSQLTMVLSKVALFRCDVPPPPSPDPDRVGEPVKLQPPLRMSPDGLAPTPGELARAVQELSPSRVAKIAADHRRWDPDEVRAAAVRAGLWAVCLCDPRYPEGLRNLTDSPPVLYVRGDRHVLDRCPSRAVSMVGTRHPTLTGRDAARRIAGGVARTGAVVVSGMALGIDAASHEGALLGGGPTVAVLASSADLASPTSNRPLYHRILENGAVVSELPPGTRPYLWTFPARNRIIAALGAATVVVEAPVKSGALITVEQATDIGRDTFAVPGSLANEMSEGTNLMLQDGSGAVLDGAHLVGQIFGDTAAPALLGAPREGPGLAIHDLLARGPLTLSELARRLETSLGAGELEGLLLDLELAGWVARRPDGRYRIVDRYRP